MSYEVRVFVPLNSMCSMKCEMPLLSALSLALPAPVNMPIATDLTPSILT